MTVTEILQELPQLSLEDQELIKKRIEQLQAEHFEETPEMLQALDEAIRSSETEPGYTVEQIRAEIPTWFTKSS